ncbi:MAG TPA: ribosome silencing factor [Bacillota bacterium]|nr:ribosome silencing factor [Bacillota bacterium]
MAENMDSKAKAAFVVEAMLEMKATDIVSIDLTGKSVVTDFFVIGTFNTPTHLRNTREKVVEKIEAAGGSSTKKEGIDESGWVLLDSGDVVVHLMLKREREYYNLERTWGDALLVRHEG